MKVSLYADNMHIYVESPKESTKKLLVLINGLAKLQNKKWIVFLYTSNKQLKIIVETNSK